MSMIFNWFSTVGQKWFIDIDLLLLWLVFAWKMIEIKKVKNIVFFNHFRQCILHIVQYKFKIKHLSPFRNKIFQSTWYLVVISFVRLKTKMCLIGFPSCRLYIVARNCCTHIQLIILEYFNYFDYIVLPIFFIMRSCLTHFIFIIWKMKNM